jgi:hypothetical protein
MSEATKKGLIEAATNAAEVISDTQASRLQGVIQGYTMALKDQQASDAGKQPHTSTRPMAAPTP